MTFAEYRSRSPNRPAFAVFFWWIIVRNIVRLAMWVLYHQRCIGREHVPREGPVIYAANHQSHFDPCIVGCLVGPLSALARSGLFRFKPFAWVIRQLGAIPLRQGTGDAAALRAAIAELKSGGRMMIYPEGSRTSDGAIGPFRPGMMLLVKRSGATVVPVALEGAYDVWPSTRRFPRLRGRILTMAGPGIPAAELLAVKPDEALARLRREIDSMRLKLRAELRDATAGRYPAPSAGDQD